MALCFSNTVDSSHFRVVCSLFLKHFRRFRFAPCLSNLRHSNHFRAVCSLFHKYPSPLPAACSLFLKLPLLLVSSMLYSYLGGLLHVYQILYPGPFRAVFCSFSSTLVSFERCALCFSTTLVPFERFASCGSLPAFHIPWSFERFAPWFSITFVPFERCACCFSKLAHPFRIL